MKIVLDIETVQASREEWARLAGVPLISSSDIPERADRDLFAHADYQESLQKENELYERSAFDGTFSRIVVIGVLMFSDSMNPQGAIAWYGEDEAE